MTPDPKYSPPSTTTQAALHVYAASAGSPDLPQWMRDNLMNEYRATMQRVKYLQRTLGIAPE